MRGPLQAPWDAHWGRHGPQKETQGRWHTSHDTNGPSTCSREYKCTFAIPEECITPFCILLHCCLFCYKQILLDIIMSQPPPKAPQSVPSGAPSPMRQPPVTSALYAIPGCAFGGGGGGMPCRGPAQPLGQRWLPGRGLGGCLSHGHVRRSRCLTSGPTLPPWDRLWERRPLPRPPPRPPPPGPDPPPGPPPPGPCPPPTPVPFRRWAPLRMRMRRHPQQSPVRSPSPLIALGLGLLRGPSDAEVPWHSDLVTRSSGQPSSRRTPQPHSCGWDRAHWGSGQDPPQHLLRGSLPGGWRSSNAGLVKNTRTSFLFVPSETIDKCSRLFGASDTWSETVIPPPPHVHPPPKGRCLLPPPGGGTDTTQQSPEV